MPLPILAAAGAVLVRGAVALAPKLASRIAPFIETKLNIVGMPLAVFMGYQISEKNAKIAEERHTETTRISRDMIEELKTQNKTLREIATSITDGTALTSAQLRDVAGTVNRTDGRLAGMNLTLNETELALKALQATVKKTELSCRRTDIPAPAPELVLN